jgi:murein L,D-transpeptidase YafK
MRLLVIALSSVYGLSACASAPPCPQASAVLVRTRTHRLWLCEDGRANASFPVALGRAGIGKRLQGDNKTPLGTYALGNPRPSKLYGQFIPVGYPTTDEQARGFSGGEVGIHGPRRSSRWLGRLTVLADWTRGCIALATDRDLGVVARFVLTHRDIRVLIE